MLTIGVQFSRQRAARANFARQDNRASAVAKQYACRAVLPVQYPAKCFGDDDKGIMGGSGADHAFGDGKGI